MSDRTYETVRDRIYAIRRELVALLKEAARHGEIPSEVAEAAVNEAREEMTREGMEAIYGKR